MLFVGLIPFSFSHSCIMPLTSSGASHKAQWLVLTSLLVSLARMVSMFLDIAGGNASSRRAEMYNTGTSIVDAWSLAKVIHNR